jgi:hypothetical protein
VSGRARDGLNDAEQESKKAPQRGAFSYPASAH